MAITVNTGFDSVDKAYQKMFKTITDGLEHKYGMSFDLIAFNNSSIDHMFIVRSRCRLIEKPAVVVSAELNSYTKEIKDDFPKRMLNALATESVEKQMESAGVSCLVQADLSGKDFDWHQTSFESLIDQHDDLLLAVDYIVNETQDVKSLYDAISKMMNRFYEINNSIRIGTKIWVFDQKTVSKIQNERMNYSFVSSSSMEQLNPISSATLALLDGKVNKDSAQFCIEIGEYKGDNL